MHILYIYICIYYACLCIYYACFVPILDQDRFFCTPDEPFAHPMLDCRSVERCLGRWQQRPWPLWKTAGPRIMG